MSGANPKSVRLKACAWLLCVILLTPLLRSVQAEINEYQVKASFILNFLKLTTFPDPWTEKLKSSDLPLCITSSTRGEEFFESLGGRSLGPSKVQLQKVGSQNCLAGFLTKEASAAEARSFWKLEEKKSFLSIVETEDDFAKGGIIFLKKENNKIRFRVHLERMKRSNIRLSSQLLRLAIIEE
jgi:hypothetical protein